MFILHPNWRIGALLLCLLALLVRTPSARGQAGAAPPNADLLANIVAISTGGAHTCALTSAGGVLCWGNNEYGQLGNGTTQRSATPVNVTTLGSGVKAVSVGGSHTCALMATGEVKCWGLNYYGQLGDISRTDRATPVSVFGLGADVAAISAGGMHTCALTAAGAVWCWGANDFGQLGSGTTEQSSKPVSVSGLGSGVKAIHAGTLYTCALKENGSVKCWGENYLGQLGNGTTDRSLIPVNVAGLESGVTAIATGSAHTCAQMAAGGVKCWGANDYGQLGDGTTTARYTPVATTAFSSTVASISVHGVHTCIVTAAGAAQCLGWNGDGQLGNGTVNTSTTAVNVSGLEQGVTAISAGAFYNCALMNTGRVKCWGKNQYGQLGNGAPSAVSLPVQVGGLPAKAAAISAGGAHTCALTAAGGVQCWGSNQFGQLGNGTLRSSFAPVAASGLQAGVTAVSAGFAHTCALTGGGVRCWGSNNQYQLGNGAMTDSSTPTQVSGLGSGVAAVSAGSSHACALTTSGGLKCWGDNDFGQLGDGTNYDRMTPVTVSGLSSGVATVSAGGTGTCALMTTGAVKCWGGSRSEQNQWAPLDVSGLGNGVRAVRTDANGSWACALTRAGGVKCWDITNLILWSVPLLGSDVREITVGGLHSCALSVANVLRCWGDNTYGQLGNGTTGYTPVQPDPNWQSSASPATLDAGAAHTCAIAADGSVWCWGDNQAAQVGMDPGWSPVDVLAALPPPVLDASLYLPVIKH